MDGWGGRGASRNGLEFAADMRGQVCVLVLPFFIICPLQAQEDGIIDPLHSRARHDLASRS